MDVVNFIGCQCQYMMFTLKPINIHYHIVANAHGNHSVCNGVVVRLLSCLFL